ncbi:MAG TPA: DMT family transporter [Chitinophagaceae bacterium]|jgi:drug/metabolite transporter (DMT)-like permease|nr:DMT family transporter [Chitinophagaceae bacterium]
MNRNHNPATGTGIALAVLATVVWSGNFIVARGVAGEIPPVTLAFFRWLTASVLLLPLGWKQLRQDVPVLRQKSGYLFWVALTGIALFNTFVYVAGRYSPAINLALIGTTSSPVFSLILAALFLGERISALRLTGLALCFAGILFLLSGGSLERLQQFRFSAGDGWVILGALFFAVYNILVRRKPATIRPLGFLTMIFLMGTVLLLPAWLAEQQFTPAVAWNAKLAGVILYLGLGTSVIAFLCWNGAIARLGAARTALFGNLIPVFSSLEAVWLLDEQITWIHAVSGALVLTGLLVANLGGQAGQKKPASEGGRVSDYR